MNDKTTKLILGSDENFTSAEQSHGYNYALISNHSMWVAHSMDDIKKLTMPSRRKGLIKKNTELTIIPLLLGPGEASRGASNRDKKVL